MKSNTFVITFLVLLLGLLLSIIASKKLYNPIEKILTATRNNFHTLKQEFLRSILFNRQQYNRQTLYSNFIQFKVDFNPETQYYVALVKIDNYKNFSKAKSRKRINAIKTAIMNMTAEIFSQHFVVEAVDVDDDSICLILNFDDKQETIHENTFIKLFNDARTLIMTSYQISVSIVISDLGYSIDSAHDLFRQAIAASRYRLFAGHGSIIFAEKVLAYAAKDYSYPLEKEKVLIESLMEGKIPEVKSQYMEIMEEVEAHSILALNLVVSRLAFSIDLAVKTIQKNNNIPIQEIPYSLYMLEENFETIAEIHAYFFALFDHVGQTLHEKMNSKHIELCNQIDSVIQSNYMDSNLSLDSIADSLDLSPAHITRVYKRHKLKTILEAISECRMNKAKELLRDTDLPIKEIAQMTGFNYDSYFYTVFRKENGVTPANYRKNVAAQSKTQ